MIDSRIAARACGNVRVVGSQLCFLLVCFFICAPLLAEEIAVSPVVGLPKTEDVVLDAKVLLGKKIFFDKKLSTDRAVSCASCHKPEHAFTDGERLAKGVNGKIGTRNTPSIVNARFNTTQFWDGRRQTLEEQALDPFLNRREHGFENQEAILSAIRNDMSYEDLFDKVYRVALKDITPKQVADALANFQRTILSGSSPFDLYYFNQQRDRLNESEVRGLNLFQGRARCAACHVIEKDFALMTDNQFHSLSVGVRGFEKRLADITTRLVMAKQKTSDIGNEILTDEEISELGRFVVTLNPDDIGKFKTPSLRNVALTAPYMHDGSVKTLEDAVELELYYRGAEAGRPLILTPVEKADLVAFLKSLTSPKSQFAINGE